MNWLRQNWIVPVLLIVLIAGYFLWDRLFGKRTATAGADDGAASVANLATNANAFQAWGATIERPNINNYLVKGQGNGNAYQFNWAKDRLAQLAAEAEYAAALSIWSQYQGLIPITPSNRDQWSVLPGIQGEYWEVILTRESSTDGDFYVSVILAGTIGYTTPPYLYVGVYDPREGAPNDPDSTNAKAAVRMNGVTTGNPTPVVLKSPPAGGGRPGSRT